MLLVVIGGLLVVAGLAVLPFERGAPRVKGVAGGLLILAGWALAVVGLLELD